VSVVKADSPAADQPAPAATKEAQPLAEESRRFKARYAMAVVFAVWVIAWAFLHGKQTLYMGEAELNAFHLWLNGVRDSFDSSRDSNPLFVVIGAISKGLNWLITSLQEVFSKPAFPRPVPQIGWLGAIALAVFVALAFAGARSVILVLGSMLVFGLFGYWSVSWDTLIITATAVVICVVIGVPVGIWMSRSKVASSVITPILDVMQTMPSFAYLTPLVLFFGIGGASAVVVSLVYAIPPLIRITELGIRGVSASTVEASRSLGVSGSQLLREVQLPMARSTIIVGINQCTMAALSMATIAALVDGPGLGKPVVSALQSLDIGTAFNAGLAIVLMAIMLDRTTSRASQRAEVATRTGADPRRRQIMLAVAAVVTAVLLVLSRTYMWAAVFPTTTVGSTVARVVSNANDAVIGAISPLTEAMKNVVTAGFLNPLQALMADSPWWLMAAVIVATAAILGGWRAAVTTVVCEAVILGTGLWNQAMVTLTMSLVATAMVMVVAVVLGVWMGRSKRADAAIRPILDAFQTLPPFVYLVPALALFAATRFTAIIAAMAYAVPIATKLVADGISGVSPTTVEAAQSIGSTVYQMIAKVQVPMARSAVVLAANQGLLYVLSMVVIGGLVGGGGLGYLVVAGFSQGQLFGKGLAAGIAITAMGIMIDRITQHASARYGRS
jgi:glycine betaine/proline transport system permease protein